MKKADIIKKLESEQGDTDYVLRTLTEEQTFLENHKKSVIESDLPLKVSEIHTQYDNDLFELFGKRKRGDQKTYNFLKEEFGTLKAKAMMAEKYEGEIAELRKGNPNDANRLKEITELQNTIAELKRTHEKELSDFAGKMQLTTIEADIRNARQGLKLKKDVPESVIQVYVDSVVKKLAANAEYREGKTVFLDSEKKTPLRNPQTMVPYTASELLAQEMKDLIDTGIHQPGPGIKPGEKPVNKTADGKFQVNFVRPATVTSLQKLGEYLIKEQGLKSTTPEYREAYKQLAEGLPLVDA